ncbi:50S ribosomal protein L32 [Candidatus Gottesmanbacteria bacterium]|nr:50S ribosomal protein L32 [Candidatus Gottesmanbacteria bacterium]
MTPLPKRKLSRRRQGLRRATHKLSPIVLQNCPKCGAKKLSHRLCPSCKSK